jgi:hypothetical protein
VWNVLVSRAVTYGGERAETRSNRNQHSSKHAHAAAVLEAACVPDLLIMFSRPLGSAPENSATFSPLK